MLNGVYQPRAMSVTGFQSIQPSKATGQESFLDYRKALSNIADFMFRSGRTKADSVCQQYKDPNRREFLHRST